jgi:hypothetical protein
LYNKVTKTLKQYIYLKRRLLKKSLPIIAES